MATTSRSIAPQMLRRRWRVRDLRGVGAGPNRVERREDGIKRVWIVDVVEDGLPEGRVHRVRHEVRGIEAHGPRTGQELCRAGGQGVRIVGQGNLSVRGDRAAALDPDGLRLWGAQIFDERAGLRRVFEHAEQVTGGLDGSGILRIDVREREEVEIVDGVEPWVGLKEEAG